MYFFVFLPLLIIQYLHVRNKSISIQVVRGGRGDVKVHLRNYSTNKVRRRARMLGAYHANLPAIFRALSTIAWCCSNEMSCCSSSSSSSTACGCTSFIARYSSARVSKISRTISERKTEVFHSCTLVTLKLFFFCFSGNHEHAIRLKRRSKINVFNSIMQKGRIKFKACFFSNQFFIQCVKFFKDEI